ncbi:hypothetical protein TRVA0_027S01486 [Trichomonascus vanleenenianus]|uniref:uncharacterized protein n=1 Tax=Trichomonascus vanleenenianus TaxID=2268995 RepID=UPI003EC9F27B
MTSSVQTVSGIRILCIAEVRGKLSLINELAEEHRADVVIHTGNFGFFDSESVKRIPAKTLRHIATFSPLVDPGTLPQYIPDLKRSVAPEQLSELPQFLAKRQSLNVPVYTIYGASEDLTVIEKFKDGSYSVPNLHIIDENTTFKIETGAGSPDIRLLGLGGNLLLHRFFDNGDGASTIAGTHGLMWTTALQIGQLVQTAHKTFDLPEVRFFVTHPCPSREALLAQLALSLRADYTLSSGLHFIYTASFNEYTVAPTFDAFRGKLAAARAAFMDVWETVKPQILPLVENEPTHKALLETCLQVFEKMPSHSTDSGAGTANEYLLTAYRSMWNYNLCDAQYGVTVLKVNNGKFGVETHSRGFDFAFRKDRKESKHAAPQPVGHAAPAAPAAPKAAPPPPPSAATPDTAGSAAASPAPKSLSTTPAPVEEPGLWVANGRLSESELKEQFNKEDVAHIVRVEIKESHGAASDKKFALVYFDSHENAQKALERVDKEKTGSVSLIRRNPPGSGRFRSSGGRGSGSRSGYRGRRYRS